MVMRKLLRRRSAFRAILQNLETRPFCEDLPQTSAGWLNQPRPRLAQGSRSGSARSLPGERR
jgi:hypothetical protein